jgi:AcrR family transcriptional regulator
MRPAAGTTGLTLDTIVDAALELIEADGFDALSMRKLADRCGVAAMTLYGYVRTKDELLTTIADRLFGALDLPTGDAPWDEQVKEIYRAVHRLFVEHPELAAIVARQHLNAMSAYRGAELVLGALSRAGLSAEDAVSAFVALTAYTAGFSQRQAHLSGAAGRPAERLATIDSLPADEFGHVPQMATLLVAGLTDRHFENGLDLLVRGIASRGRE